MLRLLLWEQTSNLKKTLQRFTDNVMGGVLNVLYIYKSLRHWRHDRNTFFAKRMNEMFVYLGPFRSILGNLLQIQAIFGVVFTGLSCNFYRPKNWQISGIVNWSWLMSKLLFVTTATTGGGVLFSSRCTF